MVDIWSQFSNLKPGDILYRTSSYKTRDRGNISCDYEIITKVDLNAEPSKRYISGFFFSWYAPDFGEYNRYEPKFTATYGLARGDFDGFLKDADNDIQYRFKSASIRAVFTTEDTDRLSELYENIILL
jgi:hypothetical protein